MSDVTQILNRVQQGDSKAARELLPMVYEELRKLAGARMAQEQAGQTLQPTALVHEAWLRLTGEGQHTGMMHATELFRKSTAACQSLGLRAPFFSPGFDRNCRRSCPPI